MQLLNVFRTTVSSEISQKQILQKNLVLKLLSSKRLLADHVEIVEDSLNDLMKIEAPSFEYLTFLKTSGVLTSSYVIFVHLKQKYLIPTVSAVMPIVYFQKLVNIRKRETLENKLSQFINSLDNYESAVKKNKTLLHEAQIIKSSANVLKRYDKDNKIPRNLVNSIRNVINGLYAFVKDLERYEISEKMGLVYEPFEDLQDCDLMTMNLSEEVDIKIIKDFFNVFAYIQSQVLMRFGLITATSIDDSEMILNKKIDVVMAFVKKETENISKFLDIISNVSQVQVNIQKQIDKEISMTLPKELRAVRSGSIQFSAKILTLAMHYQHLEELIVKFAASFEHPDNKKIEEILDAMKVIENEMSVGIDEHKRIAISFQKYLNMKIDDGNTCQEKLKASEGIGNYENVKKITEQDQTPHTDDFFFVDGNAAENDEDSKSNQPETIEEVNSKLAKKYFKPVLVQLKERIEVIGEDMKEREKKVLKAKGIEIQDEPEVSKAAYDDDDYGSGSDDERERERKFKRNQEKFQSNREFLESKQPINIFAAGGFSFPLKSPALDEDVLE